MNMRYRHPLIAMSSVAVAAVSLLAAGCGSNAPRVSTSAAQASQSHSIQPAINFSDCMRSHGVPDFPDPTNAPREFKQSLDPSTPHSPAFLSAARTCRHLLPARPRSQGDQHSPAQVAAALAFARCIRSHGFPSFPDPTTTGDITHQMLAGAGIDIHQPAVVRAADACAPVTHGYITQADVAHFIAGQ